MPFEVDPKKEADQVQEILQDLSLQKQKYLMAKASGDSGYKAALAAGYSDSTARNIRQIETPDVKAAFAELVRLRIKPEKIVRRLKQGLNATQTRFIVRDGVVTDTKRTVDYKGRLEYLQAAAQMGGLWTPKQEMEHTQTLDEGTAKRLIEISERLGLENLDYEKRRELRKSHVTLEAQTIENQETQ